MSFKTFLSNAREVGEPIPAFNVFDGASVRGVLRASLELARPMILQFSQRTAERLGAATCLNLARLSARQLGVEGTFVHLDHCTNPEILKDAIAVGFDGVMYDGSHLELSSNIFRTKEWVVRAHDRGVVLEGEITPIAGEEDGLIGLDRGSVEPCLAERFVKATGSDLFGGNIGTRHGRYDAPPAIDFEQIASLSRYTDAGFVIHGGSGLSRETLRRLATCGVTKVNFSTGLKEAWLLAVAHKLGEPEPLAILSACEDAIRLFCRARAKDLTVREVT